MNTATIEKPELLPEARAYLERFSGKIVLIKYGGAAMTDPSVRTNVLQDVVRMAELGIQPVVVHGGGPYLNRRMELLGKQSQFVKGFRITDEETMTLAEEEFLKINREIVGELKVLGGSAATLDGRQKRMIEVKKHPPIDGQDIGYVGDIVRVDVAAVEKLLAQDMIPVIPPMGVGPNGHAYNINADQVAAAVAAALHAVKVVFLTNVGGILRDIHDPGSLISHVDVKDIRQLISSGIVAGGMLPKTAACLRALEGGVEKTHIIDARTPHGLLRELCTDRGVGTEIVNA